MSADRPIDDYTHEQLNEMFAVAYISIPREAGDLLYLLARSRRSVHIVEFGTLFDISTIFLAAAARNNGGRVVTTEWLSAKADVAMRNFAKAGLADHIEVRVGRRIARGRRSSFSRWMEGFVFAGAAATRAVTGARRVGSRGQHHG